MEGLDKAYRLGGEVERSRNSFPAMDAIFMGRNRTVGEPGVICNANVKTSASVTNAFSSVLLHINN